jgi:SOS response associated peptidase (SRAP)
MRDSRLLRPRNVGSGDDSWRVSRQRSFTSYSAASLISSNFLFAPVACLFPDGVRAVQYIPIFGWQRLGSLKVRDKLALFRHRPISARALSPTSATRTHRIGVAGSRRAIAVSFRRPRFVNGRIHSWFAPGDDRPLFAFAGLWRPWTGPRGTKAAPVEGEHLLFSFLTTEANDVVRPIHAKAMPVILTEPKKFETWFTAPVGDALRLQRPFPNDRLKIVATGLKADDVIESAVLA